MERVDRDSVLLATDLRQLATELCGPPRGRGASAKWRCPDPAHPDEHPSMGIFRGTAGYDRWKCLACGQGGTAVDLLVLAAGLQVGEALRELAARAGLTGTATAIHPRRAPLPARTPRPTHPAAPAAPDPAVAQLVARAAELLWAPIGADARIHLAARGFTDSVLRANQVGFDPGPRHLPRPRGLPYRGPGIVYPVHAPDTGIAIYYQLRYRDPARSGRKYDQPTTALATSPHLAVLRNPNPTPAGFVVVCEGIPDGLTATHTGVTAVAILGVAHAGLPGAAHLAARLIDRFPNAAFAVCFDVDTASDKLPAGQQAADRLTDHLAHRGAPVARLRPPHPYNDLNDWWRHASPLATAEITGTAQLIVPWRGLSPLETDPPQLPALEMP